MYNLFICVIYRFIVHIRIQSVIKSGIRKVTLQKRKFFKSNKNVILLYFLLSTLYTARFSGNTVKRIIINIS